MTGRRVSVTRQVKCDEEATGGQAPGGTQVADVMRPDVPTVGLETTLEELLQITWRRGVRHVLVMDGERLAGIVSDRDIKRALTSGAVSGRPLTVADIMTRTVITVGPTATVACACDTMMQEAISALPVVEGGRLKGIVTETDVLALFTRAR